MNSLSDKKQQLHNDVSQIETDLELRIQQIKQKSAELLSVETWVRNYPLQSVGVAALVGFVFAYKTKSALGNATKELIKSELKKQAFNQVSKILTGND